MAYYDDPSGHTKYDSGFYYDGDAPPTVERAYRMAKIQLSLNVMSIAEIIQLGKNVHTALLGTTYGTALKPLLADLQTLVTNAETANDAYEAEKAVLQMKKDARDTAISALSDGLRTEASTIQALTGGDPVKIKATGFNVRATSTPVGIPTRVQDLVVTAGDEEGSLDAAWDPVYGVRSYEVQTSADPTTTTSWNYRLTVLKSSVTVNSFTSGAKVWLRVRGIGTAGPGPWSDPAVKTVP